MKNLLKLWGASLGIMAVCLLLAIVFPFLDYTALVAGAALTIALSAIMKEYFLYD